MDDIQDMTQQTVKAMQDPRYCDPMQRDDDHVQFVRECMDKVLHATFYVATFHHDMDRALAEEMALRMTAEDALEKVLRLLKECHSALDCWGSWWWCNECRSWFDPDMQNDVEVCPLCGCSGSTDDGQEEISELCLAITMALRGMASMVYAEPMHPEDRYVQDGAHLNCPTCGGSGHVDDTRLRQESTDHGGLLDFIQAVEWVPRDKNAHGDILMRCPWCLGDPALGHDQDCPYPAFAARLADTGAPQAGNAGGDTVQGGESRLDKAVTLLAAQSCPPSVGRCPVGDRTDCHDQHAWMCWMGSEELGGESQGIPTSCAECFANGLDIDCGPCIDATRIIDAPEGGEGWR